jgi:hypothetical protein
MNKPLLTLRAPSLTAGLLAGAALLCGPAQAASADDAMATSLQHYVQIQSRGAWHNALMPQGTGDMVAAQASGDMVMHAVLASYDRVALDRGGWANPWVDAAHYAVGEPLLAVKVGDGVTTAGAPRPAAVTSVVAWR